MANVKYKGHTNAFWNYGGYYGPYSSPSLDEGDSLIAIKVDNDGRNSIALPYIISGTVYATNAHNQSGGGGAWTGSARVSYWDRPGSGVQSVYQNGGAQGTLVLLAVAGMHLTDPIGVTYGGYGGGNPNRSYDGTPENSVASLIVGAAHCGTGSGHYEAGNEGTNLYLKESNWVHEDPDDYTRTKFHQYSELCSNAYGPTILHYYDWAGYKDNVLVWVEFKGQPQMGGVKMFF